MFVPTKNNSISIPAKFAFGMLVCGLAYVAFSIKLFLVMLIQLFR